MRAFILTFFFLSFAHAQEPQVEIQQSKIPHFLRWIPTGARAHPLPPHCSTTTLEQILLKKQTPAERRQKTDAYFSTCHKYLIYHGSTNGFSSILRQTQIDFDFIKSPRIKKILITLPNGLKVHGLLALKPDKEPRPLVLIQCGLTCNTLTSGSPKSPLMHLFDESPFHVLLVGSSTSAEFAIANQRFYVGGFQEGQTLYQVAKWLRTKESGLSEVTSSIHLLGLSLGGHAVLYATLFNDDPDNEKLIGSSQSLCPVVDLKPTIDFISTSSPPTLYLQSKIRAQLKQMIGKVPIIDQLLPDGRLPANSRLPEIVSRASLDFSEYVPFFNALFSFFKSLRPTSLADYWSLNDFKKQASHISTPTTVWAAIDDPAIPLSTNAGPLQDTVDKTSGSLQILTTPYGSHCAFDLSYGWDVVTVLMRSNILAQSAEFLPRYTRTESAFSSNLIISPKKIHLHSTFTIHREKKSLNIYYLLFQKDKPECKDVDPYLLPKNSKCFLQTLETVKLEDLKIPWLDSIESDVDQQELVRWANANMVLLTKDRKPLVGTTEKPAFVSWPQIF